MAGTIGAMWGIMGVILIVAGAVYRLAPLSLTAFSSAFRWYHWLTWIGSVLVMAYAEGYRGFQLHFSPRAAARALYLRDHPKLIHVIFAPLFCIGYFHAARRRRIASISLTVGITVLAAIVRLLRQPWRGIVDAGVVAGLAWGLISIVWFAARALGGQAYNHSPEVPEQVSSKR